MKKTGRIILLILLIVASVLVVTSCKKGSGGVSEIVVKNEGMPQLVFVLGQELDLSNGMLTVTQKGETKDIPMTSEGVTVSGFDKNVLGEQTLTIEYGGKTTQITVTVVERMQLVDYAADYLVGDDFDTEKGRLKITRNDGTSYTVALNSSKVTIENFDSSAASQLTLTVRFDSGEETYESQFKVNVYAVESVDFHKPNKVAYSSHESALDLTGGYFTLKGNGGKLEKDVALTEDMVSGFDLTAVTKENSPYTQKITVTYNGKTYEYEIKLTYTDISQFKEAAATLSVLDWTAGQEPEVSEEQGLLALDMIKYYLDMSPAERAYITEEESLSVARPAIVYGFNVWADEIQKYNDAFAIEYGELVLYCESYEAVEKAIQGLQDTESVIYTYSPILLGIIDAFGEQVVSETEEGILTFDTYPVLDANTCRGLEVVFEYMLELYNKFAEIPDDWKTQGIDKYATKIEGAYDYMVGEGAVIDPSLYEIYYYLSSWRTNDDAFDILYTYYYSQKNESALLNLSSIRLPSSLEDIYMYLVSALDQITQMQSYLVMDASEFLYDYYKALQLSEQIKTSGDTMTKELYDTLPINAIMGMEDSTYVYFDSMIEYIRTTDGGYYSRSGGLLGKKEYQALMDHYMNILFKQTDDEAYVDSAAYGADIEKMFQMYVALSPSQQNSFLNTLNACYTTMGIPQFVFDDSEENEMFTCLFAMCINDYYKSKFNEESSAAAYVDLVLAMEIYSRRYTDETWQDEFIAKMDSVKAAYENMTGADKQTFDQYLGSVYADYAAISERCKNPAPAVDLGEWADDFQALKDAITNTEVAYYLIENNYTMYSMFFSAYERAQILSQYILENAPAEILNAYFHENLYVIDASEEETLEDEIPDDVIDEEAVESVEWSYDYVMCLYRSLYVNYLLSCMDSCIYDYYVEWNMADLFNKCYDVTWAYLYSDDDPATVDFDKDKVLAAMRAFQELPVEAQTTFIFLEGEYGYYYVALDAFLTEAYNEKVATAARKVLELEQQYLLYFNLQNEETLEALTTALNEAKELYAGLSGADKASFADFEEAYAYYVKKAEAVITA